LVEMQMLWTESFQQRVLFNASKAYVRQLRPGDEYKCLQPVISLNLLNDKYLEDKEGWYHHYKIVEVEKTGHVIQGLEFVFVELPKFRADAAEEVGEEGKLWLRFLTEVGEVLHGKEVPEELLRDGGVRQAVEMVEAGAYSEGEIATYDAYWDAVSLERTVIGDSIREGIEQGKQIGMVEGKQIGMVEGKQIGMVEGEQIGMEKGERKTKIALAKKMVEAGMDVLQIEELTGLKVSEWMEGNGEGRS